MSWQEIENYCKRRLQEIEAINHSFHTPTAFVPLAAFIAFLSKLAYYGRPKSTGNGVFFQETDYVVEFGNAFYPKNSCGQPKYDPETMYKVLRCGIVHSFSFDDKWDPRKNPPQPLPAGLSKIIITHNADRRGMSPSTFSTSNSTAQVINAFDFCDDVAQMISLMFTDHDVQKNSEDVVSHQRLMQDMVDFVDPVHGNPPNVSQAGQNCTSFATPGLTANFD